MGVEPIQRRKLYHEVFDRLLDRIRRAEFAPGDQLPSERDLMESYGVGRPAVREALQTLARSGIVSITHGERARVVVPTGQLLIAQMSGGAQHLLRSEPNMLAHLKDARVFLETGVARLAAERATPSDVVRLRQRIQDQREALSNAEQFLVCDMAFHRELAVVSGNPIYAAVVEALFKWASEYYQTIVRAPGAEHLTVAEHDRIVNAVADHDLAGAELAMREHLTRANALYKRVVT
jgi:GntR family transcriptional regulator, sialic acid-inducible nan operon repressor